MGWRLLEIGVNCNCEIPIACFPDACIPWSLGHVDETGLRRYWATQQYITWYSDVAWVCLTSGSNRLTPHSQKVNKLVWKLVKNLMIETARKWFFLNNCVHRFFSLSSCSVYCCFRSWYSLGVFNSSLNKSSDQYEASSTNFKQQC